MSSSDLSHFPLQIPSSEFQSGILLLGQLVCLDGTVVESSVLKSTSGVYYEIGPTLKSALYGRISVGHVVTELDKENNIFSRTDNLVAIKIMMKSRIREYLGCGESVDNEVAVMQFYKSFRPSISPPFSPIMGGPNRYSNLVHLFETCQDSHNVYNIMEFVPGCDLSDLIGKLNMLNQHLDESSVRKIFCNILDGLEKLHSLGICHRDLSLENIVVTEDLARCVIIDYGMSLRCDRVLPSGNFQLLAPSGQIGKRRYMAPEVFENKSPFDGSKVDMWALGIILFVLLTNVHPIHVASVLDKGYQCIMCGKLPELLVHWGFVFTPDAVNLLTLLLRPDPSERPHVGQIMRHKWIKS